MDEPGPRNRPRHASGRPAETTWFERVVSVLVLLAGRPLRLVVGSFLAGVAAVALVTTWSERGGTVATVATTGVAIVLLVAAAAVLSDRVASRVWRLFDREARTSGSNDS